jgi:hypothetical protein
MKKRKQIWTSWEEHFFSRFSGFEILPQKYEKPSDILVFKPIKIYKPEDGQFL